MDKVRTVILHKGPFTSELTTYITDQEFLDFLSDHNSVINISHFQKSEVQVIKEYRGFFDWVAVVWTY